MAEVVAFGTGEVRALAHVARDDGSEARVILCDDLPLDAEASEMVALPVFDCMDANFGAGQAGLVHIWQLGTDQRFAVRREAAEARRPAVRALLSIF